MGSKLKCKTSNVFKSVQSARTKTQQYSSCPRLSGTQCKEPANTFIFSNSSLCFVYILQDIYDSIEFSATARNDVEIVNNMSKKLKMKLNKATNIINDVCKFVVAEAPKITRNSCNKFNTFLTPCPAPAPAAMMAAATPFQQRLGGSGGGGVGGVVVSSSSVSAGGIAIGGGSDFQTWQPIDKLKSGSLIFDSNHAALAAAAPAPAGSDTDNLLTYLNITSSGSGTDVGRLHVGTAGGGNGGDDIDEENRLNRQLQKYAAARIAYELDKEHLLNVKQHYFLSKYDQSTDNKCQYFDATHLR